MRVLICGDRNYGVYLGDSLKKPLAAKKVRAKARRKMLAFIITLPKNTVIIDGGAKGADSLANEVALENGYPTERYFAQWNLYGRAAGPIRNKQMLDEGRPDKVAYFHDDIENSKGTADMISISRKAGIEVIKGG